MQITENTQLKGEKMRELRKLQRTIIEKAEIYIIVDKSTEKYTKSAEKQQMTTEKHLNNQVNCATTNVRTEN